MSLHRLTGVPDISKKSTKYKKPSATTTRREVMEEIKKALIPDNPLAEDRYQPTTPPRSVIASDEDDINSGDEDPVITTESLAVGAAYTGGDESEDSESSDAGDSDYEPEEDALSDSDHDTGSQEP